MNPNQVSKPGNKRSPKADRKNANAQTEATYDPSRAWKRIHREKRGPSESLTQKIEAQ